ncbi:MAG: serine/threonine-protein kinase [Verrucomicrobia subdivision 3 bacterium]|nr:serine/threonine-protein kinase [Limisphaerales bacterium]
MSAKSAQTEHSARACTVAFVVLLISLVAWWFRIGEGISYDLPFRFARPITLTNVVIITMDEASHRELDQRYGTMWDRPLHAGLLRWLKKAGARLVIFDVVFADSDTNNPAKDADLRQAMAEFGNVLLAGDDEPIAEPGISGTQVNRPLPFIRAARGWGLSILELESDNVVRRHYSGTEIDPSLSWAAATMLGAPVTTNSAQRFAERWIRFYAANPIEKINYYSVTNRDPDFFKGKVVFIGGKPRTRFLGERVDEFRTPVTVTQGVDIHATMLLNLLRADWLERMRVKWQIVLVITTAVVLGFGLPLVRPFGGAVIALISGCLVAGFGVFSAIKLGIWFPWAAIAGIVAPAAWICSLAAYKGELRTVAPYSTYEEPLPMPVNGEQPEVTIPNYALLKCIGRGAYGEVWLARNRIGMLQAVKIVFRKRFNEVSPYEREFRGIRKYMPISLRHTGLVRILYVGRDDHHGFFYYAMELGDDETRGQEIDPEKYSPRNLAKDLDKRGHLSVAECVAMGLALADPLEFLHNKNLMHRDIKPANIIFVDGIPKLADIGLVTEFSGTGTEASYIGTEGYMAPEGPSKPTADIYSFGKVLYEAAMGLDRRQFPTLPDWINEERNVAELMALNSIVVKCCDNIPRRRYQSVGELHEALLQLERRLAKQPA